MKQRGVLDLALIFAVACGVLTLALIVAVNWARHEAKSRAEIEGKFTAFKKGAEDAGKKAQKEKDDEINRVKGESVESEKRWAARVASANARADGLCKRAGLSSGCRDLPAIPDTARPPDDAAYNQRLLEVLRHAQAVVDQVIEFQLWEKGVSRP